MSTVRQFNEILRVLDSCQLTMKHKVATPSNWKKGDEVMMVPALNNEEAKKVFTDSWKMSKPYLRKAAGPSE